MEDIRTSLEALHKKLDILLSREIPISSNQDLYAALASAQSEMNDMVFTGENIHYKDKFATLGDLIRMSRPALTKYGLAVFQDIRRGDDNIDILRTTMCHTSGQTIHSEMRIMPNKNTLHTIGSYLAYIRRISYSSLVGLMVHDLDDDDGHTASQENIDKIKKGVTPEQTSKDTQLKEFKRLSKAQIADIEKAMGTHFDLGQDLLSKYGVDGFSELPETKYEFILGQMRKNVAYREGELV